MTYLPDLGILALTFSAGLITFLLGLHGDDLRGKEFTNSLLLLRRVILFGVSAIFWITSAGIAGTDNNCLSAFGVCFTSPTFASNTTIIYTDFVGSWLQFACYGMFTLSILLVIAFWFFDVVAVMRNAKKNANRRFPS